MLWDSLLLLFDTLLHRRWSDSKIAFAAIQLARQWINQYSFELATTAVINQIRHCCAHDWLTCPVNEVWVSRKRVTVSFERWFFFRFCTSKHDWIISILTFDTPLKQSFSLVQDIAISFIIFPYFVLLRLFCFPAIFCPVNNAVPPGYQLAQLWGPVGFGPRDKFL